MLGVATAKDRCFIVFSNINITMNELNGQWLECGGIPCFCPDNSPSPYDHLWDDDIEDTEDIEDTKEVTEFREKCKLISRYSSLIEPLEFEIESNSRYDEF